MTPKKTAGPRVLHVAETIMGGVTSYLQETIAYQSAELGAENIRLLVPSDHAQELSGIDAEMISTFSRTGRNAGSMVAFAVALSDCLASFQPTIVHLHSSFAGAIARPLLWLSRPRPRIVYCPHGWSFLMEIPEWKRRSYAFIERTLARITDVVINISRHEDHQARAHGIPAGKCVMVRNGVSSRLTPCGLSSSPFDESFVNLLFVGRFDRQKGLDLLFRVMERLQDLPIRLHVIGCSVHDGLAIQPPSNVTIIGWLDRHQLQAYYAAADGLVVPSRWEGFGLVTIEAMRAGTAVIASNRGSLPELVEHGITGYIFDLDENDLGELERTLRGLEKDRLREMGVAAARLFEQGFTAEAMNRALLDVYSQLHERPAAQGAIIEWSRGRFVNRRITDETRSRSWFI
jgi:glycosyltransferase involved in cell wall biosynthesis